MLKLCCPRSAIENEKLLTVDKEKKKTIAAQESSLRYYPSSLNKTIQ